VVPRLLGLIEDVTNWYIRFSRQRLKGDRGVAETVHALNTLFDVLYTIARSFAPFIPFLTDKLWLHLQEYMPRYLLVGDVRSVHFLPFPEPRQELFDEVIERRFARMRTVVGLGRTCREKEPPVSLKQSLMTLTVFHPDQEYLDDIVSLANYIKDELSIVSLVLSSDESRYGVQYTCTADWTRFGKKFRNMAKKLSDALTALPSADVRRLMQTGSIAIGGTEVTAEDVIIKRRVTSDSTVSERVEIGLDKDTIIILDKTIYPDLKDERLGREIVSCIQKLRKKAGLRPTDDVRIEYAVIEDPDDIGIEAAFSTQAIAMEKKLRHKLERYGAGPLEKACDDAGGGDKGEAGRVIIEEVQEILNSLFSLKISTL